MGENTKRTERGRTSYGYETENDVAERFARISVRKQGVISASAEEQGRRLERPKRRLRCRVGYSSGRLLGYTALVTASSSSGQ